jgi:hypothetical protein
VNLFFPDIKSDTLKICFTAWLSFVCVTDDILETLPPAKDTRVQDTARLLYSHCTRQLSQPSSHVFFKAVCVVFRAFIGEIWFLEGRILNTFANYISIRRRTICLNPPFDVIKNEYLAQADW